MSKYPYENSWNRKEAEKQKYSSWNFVEIARTQKDCFMYLFFKEVKKGFFKIHKKKGQVPIYVYLWWFVAKFKASLLFYLLKLE